MRFLYLIFIPSVLFAQGGINWGGIGEGIGNAIQGNRVDPSEKLYFNDNTTGSQNLNNDPRNMNKPENDISAIESHLKETKASSEAPVIRGTNSRITTTTGTSPDGETMRTLMEESATARYLVAMQAARVLTAASLSFINPAFAASLNSSELNAQTAVGNNQTNQNRVKPDVSPAEVAVIQCADRYIQEKQKESAADPKVFVPPFQAAIEFCESLAQKGQLDKTAPAIKLGANAHLASYPAHPLFLMARYNNAENLKKFFPASRLTEPNTLYLWEILTLRYRSEIELSQFIYGFANLFGAGKSFDLKAAHKEIDEVEAWMKLYAGDTRYVYQNSQFSKSGHVTDQDKFVAPKLRYLSLIKAAYRDLMGAANIICNYQNRLDGAGNTYVPFTAISHSDMNQQVHTVNPNDMWERLEKAGLATALRNRLRNLSAGPFYSVDIALPSAIHSLFVNHENPIAEVQQGTGEFAPRQVQVDCSKLTDDNSEKISFYLEQIEKGTTEGGVKVFSPRVRYAMLFAHNIALAQMSHEAVSVFRKLEGIYGYPNEDQSLVESGEWMAIRDLRELLGTAAGYKGDQFKGRPFELAYAERVRTLNELTMAIATELDKVRGTGGGTLTGLGAVSAGGGVPFR